MSNLTGSFTPVLEAAVHLVNGLDGTFGKTPQEVADALEARDYPLEVDARLVARLVRASADVDLIDWA